MDLDTRIFLLLNSPAGKSRWGDRLIAFFAEYLAYIISAIFILFVAYSPHFQKEQFIAFDSAVAAGLIARFGIASNIRLFWKRHRPYKVHAVKNVLYENSLSFPSGHATFFFGLSAVAAYYDFELGLFMLLATLVMTIFRVVAGVHYLSDILGGMAIGLLSAVATMEWIAPLLRLAAMK